MHKVYTAKITQFGPLAVVVVTAFTNAGGYHKAESFCVFPKPHEEQSFVGLRFDEKSFSDSPIELNTEFMLEEALSQARIDIGNHIEKHYSAKAFVIPSGELKIQEVGASFLAHLRVREVADFLCDIKNKTECEDLRAAIEPILSLPAISYRRL